MASAVLSPSGRVEIRASRDAWTVWVDGKLIAQGRGRDAHIAALEELAHTAQSCVVKSELYAAADYWRQVEAEDG